MQGAQANIKVAESAGFDKRQGMDLTTVKKIACVGEVMIELTEAGPVTARLGVAGDTYNSAVYLKRLLGDAASVDYVTALGTDAFSDRILSEMTRHGIGTRAIERRDTKTPGLYAISTDQTGERSFAYWRSDSAARTLFAAPCTVTLDHLADYDLVVLSGITLAILPPDMRAALASALADQPTLVAYDSNHRPKLWETAAAAIEWNTTFWGLADIALPSVDDEMAIHGDASEADVLNRLQSSGATFGALKRGPIGPLDLSGSTPEQTFEPATQVIDTTAAGDSFNAGFIAALIQGAPMADALQSGHRLAAHVIGQKGAIVDLA